MKNLLLILLTVFTLTSCEKETINPMLGEWTFDHGYDPEGNLITDSAWIGDVYMYPERVENYQEIFNTRIEDGFLILEMSHLSIDYIIYYRRK